MAIISFNFTGEEYSSPTGSGSYGFEFPGSGTECLGEWVDSIYDTWSPQPDIVWNECLGEFAYLNQIWHDEYYAYAATTDGLNIIDLISELPYAHVTYDGGFNSLWADDDRIYLATPNDGIKYIDKACISGSTDTPYELVGTCLSDYSFNTAIASNRVRYIHGNNGYTAVVTISGVDVRGPDTYYEVAFGNTKLARKCFITLAGKTYYTTYDGSSWQINVVNQPIYDWSTPDKVHSFMFPAGIDINDIFVDNDIIYAATSNGIYVINDASEDIEYSVYLVEG